MSDEKPDPLEVAQRITPLGEMVVCLPLEADTTTASGLVLVNADEEVPSMARIVAVGPGVNPTLEVGQTVLYQKYQGTRYTLDGVQVLVLGAEFIDGIVTLPAVAPRWTTGQI